MAEQLTCERCGHTEEVAFPVDENGRNLTVAEYIAAVKAAGLPVLCSGCAGEEQAAEDIYRDDEPT